MAFDDDIFLQRSADAHAADQLLSRAEPYVIRRTGREAMSVEIGPFGRPVRLVGARAHFEGGAGTAVMQVSLKSGGGDEYNALLHTTGAIGVGSDLNYAFPVAEVAQPSAWTFFRNDSLVFSWSNPGDATWGLEVLLANA